MARATVTELGIAAEHIDRQNTLRANRCAKMRHDAFDLSLSLRVIR